MSRPALFLDRDGVINVDHGYVSKPEQFDFIEGIFDLVVAANQTGYLTVVVTNQAGIGRGYYTEADFHRLTDWMCRQFAMRGAQIDAVYYCPSHPEHGIGEYRKDDDCRKPAPGMLLQAQNELDIDLKRSVLVGDKLSDIQAGERAGVEILIYYGDESCDVNSTRITRLSQVVPYLVPFRI
ncbi:D-glycero-beta-D-manno-heptose 1,7-bisphosphate 7-phosphatase [Candidatus Saccharibacteria bacterium]|nr:D-glycero-beta-D-manno-heptose 1,7-bisphosphate 7-phosphatase [Candidatus Saccharibacteria bacterium]